MTLGDRLRRWHPPTPALHEDLAALGGIAEELRRGPLLLAASHIGGVVPEDIP